MFKNTITQKNILKIGIVIFIISILSILFLSISINDNYETTYKEIVAKSFTQKTKSLEFEFNTLDNQINTLSSIVRNTAIDELTYKYEVLKDITNSDSTGKNYWYIALDKNNEILSNYISNNRELSINSAFFDKIINTHQQSKKNIFITQNNHIYWLLWNKVKSVDGNQVITGFSIDLKMLHHQLSDNDIATPNYAYIFTNNGICIYHPEVDLIGTNVFQETTIFTQDSLTTNAYKEPQIVLSEYLNMDVLRYITPFESENFDGYISINFPKVNVDESLTHLKQNTFLIFTSSILLILISFYFFTAETKKTYKEKELIAVEKEKIKKEKALIQLKQLKNQINPHFLFNSLNSLYMLIGMDEGIAQKFTLNLSKTYRYLITPPTDNIVKLDDELLFIKQYIELQKIRFTKELICSLNDTRQQEHLHKIPYLALQIVIENAFKHNIATIEKPLKISIDISDDEIRIANTYQPKKQKEEGEGFGLNYLNSIYNYYNMQSYTASIENDDFVIVLPMFKC